MSVLRHGRVRRAQSPKRSRDPPRPKLRRRTPRERVRRRRRRLDLPPLFQLAPLERQIRPDGGAVAPAAPRGQRAPGEDGAVRPGPAGRAAGVRRGLQRHGEVPVEDLSLEEGVGLDDAPLFGPLFVRPQAVVHADAAVARGAGDREAEVLERGLQRGLRAVAGVSVGLARLGVRGRLARDEGLDLVPDRAERVEVRLGVGGIAAVVVFVVVLVVTCSCCSGHRHQKLVLERVDRRVPVVHGLGDDDPPRRQVEVRDVCRDALVERRRAPRADAGAALLEHRDHHVADGDKGAGGVRGAAVGGALEDCGGERREGVRVEEAGGVEGVGVGSCKKDFFFFF